MSVRHEENVLLPPWDAFVSAHPSIRSGDWQYLFDVDWTFRLRHPARPVNAGPPAAESLAAKELVRAALAFEFIVPRLAEHERLTYLHTRCRVSGITFYNQRVPASLIVTSKRVFLVDYCASGTKPLADDAPPRRIKLEYFKGTGLETAAVEPRDSGGFVVLKHGVGFPRRRVSIFVPCGFDGGAEEAFRAASAIRKGEWE